MNSAHNYYHEELLDVADTCRRVINSRTVGYNEHSPAREKDTSHCDVACGKFTFVDSLFEGSQGLRDRLIFAFVSHGRMFARTIPESCLIIDRIVYQWNDKCGFWTAAGRRVVVVRTRYELKLKELDRARASEKG